MGANIDLARLKSLLDAATAGEWTVEGVYEATLPPSRWKENRELIAALRNSAPALISELESLRAENEALKKAMAEPDDECRSMFAALAHFDAQEGK